MKDTCYLILNVNGIKQYYKEKRYKIGDGEKVFTLNIEIPDWVFKEDFLVGNLSLTPEEQKQLRDNKIMEFEIELKRLKSKD